MEWLCHMRSHSILAAIATLLTQWGYGYLQASQCLASFLIALHLHVFLYSRYLHLIPLLSHLQSPLTHPIWILWVRLNLASPYGSSNTLKTNPTKPTLHPFFLSVSHLALPSVLPDLLGIWCCWQCGWQCPHVLFTQYTAARELHTLFKMPRTLS